MERFEPKRHLPKSQEDRKKIENALWEGWELWVNVDNGVVWIGRNEEKIADVVIR